MTTSADSAISLLTRYLLGAIPTTSTMRLPRYSGVIDSVSSISVHLRRFPAKREAK